MLSLKQANYIHSGLHDNRRCSYYKSYNIDEILVFIDSRNDKNLGSVIYGINFENAEKAKYFAENCITYDECYFDVFTHGKTIIIEPIRVDGVLKIRCGSNEELAKKLVKKFRAQNIERLNRAKQAKKSARQDFKGIEF